MTNIDIHIAKHCLFHISQFAMNPPVYWLCVAMLLSCTALVQSELYPTDPQDWSLFPYGAGAVLPDRNDANWPVDWPVNITFFGTSYNILRVSILYLRDAFSIKIIKIQAVCVNPMRFRIFENPPPPLGS